MSHFAEILSSVVGVYLVMLLGALARRFDWLSANADQSLAAITANLFIPCLFVHRILTNEHTPELPNALLPTALGFGCTAGGYLLAWLLARFLGPYVGMHHESERRAFIACVGIANYTYIPLPIAEAIFPEAVVSLLIHNVGVDMAMWSLGIWVLCGDLRSNWKRILLGPPLLAMLTAYSVKMMGSHVQTPSFILAAIQMCGACAIPMGLLLGGAIIFDQAPHALRSLRTGAKTIALASCIRQILLPISFILLTISLSLKTELRQVLLLQAAMPCATFPIVLVRLYHQDISTAVRVVVGTSLIAVVTIPVWIYFGAWLLSLFSWN